MTGEFPAQMASNAENVSFLMTSSCNFWWILTCSVFVPLVLFFFQNVECVRYSFILPIPFRITSLTRDNCTTHLVPVMQPWKIWVNTSHEFAMYSMWLSYAIWCYWSGSTLVQVMTCCLRAPSHFLNQCWLIINVFSGIQMTAIFQEVLVLSFCKIDVKSTLLKLLPQLPETRDPFY